LNLGRRAVPALRLVAPELACDGKRGSLPRTLPSFEDVRLMGPAASVGPAGVTLQFAIALRAHGWCAAGREFNLARRRRRAPWLLGAGFSRRLVSAH